MNSQGKGFGVLSSRSKIKCERIRSRIKKGLEKQGSVFDGTEQIRMWTDQDTGDLMIADVTHIPELHSLPYWDQESDRKYRKKNNMKMRDK